GGRAAAADASLIIGADLVVDGIVGIGGRGALRGAAVKLAEAAADVLTVAVDMPSGVDADTGWVGEDAIRADVTVT
ncbi:MAG: bifunctional ADP-dependent NAD(P)H-hydrate dehydratase/NAD(P)H-hydrate epimerase, partial [Pseudonocardiales bacterium]